MIFYIWELFDFLHVATYSINSYRLGNTPYFSDLVLTSDNISSHGGIFTGSIVIFSWLLELSILVSLLMFVLMKSKVKLLCYAQTPFRLIFLIPSIPITLPILRFLGESTTFITIFIVVVSEFIKIYSLRKRM